MNKPAITITYNSLDASEVYMATADVIDNLQRVRKGLIEILERDRKKAAFIEILERDRKEAAFIRFCQTGKFE